MTTLIDLYKNCCDKYQTELESYKNRQVKDILEQIEESLSNFIEKPSTDKDIKFYLCVDKQAIDEVISLLKKDSIIHSLEASTSRYSDYDYILTITLH